MAYPLRMAVCGYAIFKYANAKEKWLTRSGWLVADMQNSNTPRRKRNALSAPDG